MRSRVHPAGYGQSIGCGYAFTHADRDAPRVIENWEPMLDDGSMTAFFDQLTLRSSMLFSDDGDVPCGLMFRQENGQTLFFSASAEISGMYQEHRDQHAVGGGPAQVALSASTVQVAHDTGDPAHPAYFRVTASLGFASIISVPLSMGTGGSAALNFYARPKEFFTEDRQRIALAFGRQVETSVELMLRAARYQGLTSDLRAAMRSRSSIDIAVGIVVAQNQCTQLEAFTILKRASNARNVKLHDLARDMITRVSGAPPRLHFSP